MTTKKKESLRTRLERQFDTRLIPVFQRATEDGQGVDLWVANLEDFWNLKEQAWSMNNGSWPGFSVRLASACWKRETRKGYVAYGQWIEG